MLLAPRADFALARALRSAQGAPLGDVFSFVSSLYFRGKLNYAEKFGCAPPGLGKVFVISQGGGLLTPHQPITVARLQKWAQVPIHQDNPHFTAPLVRHASELRDAHDEHARFVLLGSVASDKYVSPLLDVFGERLLFPREFAGLGDMSRGALLLRAVREERELAYATVAAEVARTRSR
jgi:hypothetical protein